MNSFEKYYWIKDHPAFINPDYIDVQFEIDPHMVCPLTNRIEKYEKLNTKMQLWVEVLVPYQSDENSKFEHAHDWDLDTGGETWEIMIDKLYELVLRKYGAYTEEERDELCDEVYGTRTATMAKSALHRWSIMLKNENPRSWANDVLDDLNTTSFKEDIEQCKNTINALTEYRKTCSIDEYKEVDAEIEHEKFLLYQTELSLQTGIDLT